MKATAQRAFVANIELESLVTCTQMEMIPHYDHLRSICCTGDAMNFDESIWNTRPRWSDILANNRCMTQHTIDGSEILYQLRLVVYPIIYRVLYIQTVVIAGFLNHQQYSSPPRCWSWNYRAWWRTSKSPESKEYFYPSPSWADLFAEVKRIPSKLQLSRLRFCLFFFEAESHLGEQTWWTDAGGKSAKALGRILCLTIACLLWDRHNVVGTCLGWRCACCSDVHTIQVLSGLCCEYCEMRF